MPKSSVVQLVLIIVGIIAAYTGVMHFLSNAVYTFMLASQMNGEFNWQYTLVSVLITAAYFLAAYFLITHSKSWSQSIVSRSGLGDFGITAQPRQILFFLFVAIGIMSLLEQIPAVLELAINGFRGRALAGEPTGIIRPRPEEWIQTVLNLLAALLLVLFAAPLSGYFAGKLEQEGSITIGESTSEGV
jgi:hypothetical protein